MKNNQKDGLITLNATWKAPGNVKTLITTRHSGYSNTPFSSFNLATHVDDDLIAVNKNRNLLTHSFLPGEPYWLKQEHTNSVANLDLPDIKNRLLVNPFDASITRTPNRVAAILTADCVPILLTDIHGSFVSAVHAGWRGLLNGIIITSLSQIKISTTAHNVLAYIGPTLCKHHFEVDERLYESFLGQNPWYIDCFTPITGDTNNDGNNSNSIINNDTTKKRYHCDLVQLTTEQLVYQGVNLEHISHNNHCTYCNKDLFYSYRRDGVTGRFASLIWLDS